LRDKSKDVWEECYRSPFVQGLGDGALDRDSFKFYLIQDYIYLIRYARVFAAGALRSPNERIMSHFTAAQHSIICGEMELHRSYMREFGITEEEAGAARQSLMNNAYTSNMMSVALTGGAAETIAVALPCAWSYRDYAVRLARDFEDKMEGNFYRSWVRSYSSDEYRASFEWMFGDLDELCEGKTGRGLAELEEIFRTSVEFEYLFWDMSYKRQMSY
ncbi:MAG: thiaminase II, partial [Synergistaceae bacterium]|nr:thiaminase II [Synergistaceae bacterium]